MVSGQDSFARVVKNWARERHKWFTVYWLACCRDDEISIFSGGGKMSGISEMHQAKVVLVVASNDPHPLLLEKLEDVFVFKNSLAMWIQR